LVFVVRPLLRFALLRIIAKGSFKSAVERRIRISAIGVHECPQFREFGAFLACRGKSPHPAEYLLGMRGASLLFHCFVIALPLHFCA
jgi:hypothetical protein